MSGHSKWSTIKHQKATTDARRGQLFTKLSREIMLAVRQGGGSDLETNFKLRLAVQKAKDSNMPSDTIERSIKRAAGEEGQEHLEEIVYEGYGSGGVAIMVQCLTSNRNRTSAEVRSVFTRGGGHLGEAGSVAWNFQARGVITLNMDPDSAEDVALLAIDAGAEDVKVEGRYLELYTSPEKLEALRRELEGKGIEISSSEESRVPNTTVSLGEREAEQTLRLLDSLEELADVQKVYSNADFPEAVLESYSSQGQGG